MDRVYRHQEVEERWSKFWEEGGFFTPKITRGKKPFVIPMPPPNVTGELHIGHALEDTLTDILTRYHRMKGEPTLWIPGTDHAGIATQNVVEKELAREGKSRFDFSPEKFVEYIWKWIDQYQDRIYVQHKGLGASADWSKKRFTMDPNYQEAVREAFNQLKEKGLIYQGEYIVNWCPRCETAISDLENEYEEEEGTLYFLSYGTIDIATTRPETIFADVAVAVHPKDKRYKNLVGKFATLPLTGRKLPIISDAAINMEFGTGALKVTPAHDELDFEIGQRHGLPSPAVIDLQGKVAKSEFVPEKYQGLGSKEAKEMVVTDLKAAGLIKKEEKIKHSRGHCQRCGTLTEPLISKQWFIKMKPLAEPAIKAVKEGKIEIIPRRFEKVYFHWMENIRDWCISRQIWWGHAIPVPGKTDVLDTWFSSALWPFATLGWPKKTTDLEYFFPATFLQSGYEILFFWDARMIMFSLFFTGKVPFKTLYLHGIVRDEKGIKMSKSSGNVIDPLDVVEKYGADALRMALIIGATPGNDMRLSEEKILGYRNFSNKIWNIGRFIILDLQGKRVPFYQENIKGLTEEDKKILADLNQLIRKVTKNLDQFRFGQAAQDIYEFLWHRFADKYVESSKQRIAQGDTTVLAILRHVFLNCLKLLHPFMPFITEELWSKFERFKKEPLTVSLWPKIS